MLRGVLKDAAENRGHRRTQEFAGGKIEGLIFCGESADVSAALRTVDRRARFTIVYQGGEHSLVEELAEAKVPVVLGPLGFDTAQAGLMLPGALAAADVPIVLAGGTPASAAESLRISAALAVRYGLDAAIARRAITLAPAEAAGVSKRVGAIRAGADADLIIFSGDPLKLDSRVLEVYVNGVRVLHTGRPEGSEGGQS